MRGLGEARSGQLHGEATVALSFQPLAELSRLPMKSHLEYRDAKSAKFWEVAVDGSSYTVRFGKIGSKGQSQTKTFASPGEAAAAAYALVAAKIRKGYAPTDDATSAPAPSGAWGAVFYAEGKSVSANAVLAAMRGDGKPSRKNARAVEGFEPDRVVGVAVHPARSGWLAVVDSADGCQGIGAGGWSRAAVTANHLSTDAIWARAFDDDVALAVRFQRGGSFFEAVPGTRAEVRAWLEARGVPLDASVPPSAAGKDAVVVAIEYGEDAYRTGPDREEASALVAIHDALVAGDAGALRERVASVSSERLALALAVIRGASDGDWKGCVRELATTILAEPIRRRTKPKEMTFEEEILRRAAAIGDDETFGSCVERIDAIERDAEAQSSWAQTGGIDRLAVELVESHPLRAFECYRRIATRSDEPHWHYVNMALVTLLRGAPARIVLDGDVAVLVRHVEARAKDLGQSARDAICYNLACVHARAGDADAALAALARCGEIQKQNPHPETDADLEALWGNEAFRALIAGGGAEAADEDADAAADDNAASDDEHDDDDDDDAAEARPAHIPPPSRAVPRYAIRLGKSQDQPEDQTDSALVSRIGGRPNAPSTETPWPESPHRPMRFVLQIVGKRAGGEVDLGDVSLVSVFADLDGDYFDPRYHAILLHRGECDAVLELPEDDVEIDPVRLMTFEPGADDSVLRDMDFPDDSDPNAGTYGAARSLAWADKVFGVPVGANLHADQRDSKGRPMRCLFQLVTYDDWFLWYAFVDDDFGEARLHIVRG